jgi:o-succinylbenzoate---CoA ligase
VKLSCPVASAAARFPDRLAVEFEEQRISWKEADCVVSGWERWLAHENVGRGDRVATLSWNRPELLWLWFALGRRGASMVPLNARLTRAELAPLLERSRARVVLAETSLQDRLQGARAFPSPPAVHVGPASIETHAELAALFTSGTTGAPSLVSLTVQNFVASHDANAGNLGASETQRWLGALPFFHVGGLAMAFRCALMGAGLVLERQFDASRFAHLLRRGDVTHASLVPTALQRVLELSGEPFGAGPEAILIGGGPMGAALLAKARNLALPVLQTYGLTEACSQVTTERRAEADGTTAGRALPGLEVQVVDTVGDVVAPGVVGEIRVKGLTVTPSAGPWLSTNDLGSLDERGRLTVHARRVDLILSGGENVYPAEVEAVLRESGLVDDVAVAPVVDDVWGQVPIAIVVWKGASDEASLLAFARARLAGFKVPRRLLTRAELPRNASGKLMRHELARLVGFS